jgi:hypothetical protein
LRRLCQRESAYISAIAALFGSAIGALASLATSWTRRERIFLEFIDLASKAFADALLQTSIQDPSKVILLYATMGKLRLFAWSERWKRPRRP